MNKDKFLELYNNGVHEKHMAKELNVSPGTIRKWRLKYRLKSQKQKFSFDKYKTSYVAHVKRGELLGNQETDNQQPSFASNSLEGSTTSYRVLSGKTEDSNITTSALPVNLH